MDGCVNFCVNLGIYGIRRIDEVEAVVGSSVLSVESSISPRPSGDSETP